MSGMKDCKFCDKRGLLWLPLCYSAVGAAAPAALNPLPKLSGKLGQGVSDLALTRAKYAVRLLRPGYLYVLLERKGIKYWDAYRVLEDAFLYKFNPEDPPQVEPTFSCDRSTCGINASMVAIPEAKDVPHVWSLFTPTPLTKAKLDEYKANAAKYVGDGKLQTFSPAGWLEGSTAQPHTLLAPELLTKVAEYVLFTQPGDPYASELGKALEQQLFPASKDAYAGAPPDDKGNYFGRLGTLYNTIKRIGYASFVLHDHIGITQELNDFRNAALSPVEAFLAKREGEADNQRRLEVMQAIEDVHGSVKANLVQLGAQQVALVDQANLPNHQASTAQQLRAMGRIAEAEKVEADFKEHERRKAQNRQNLLDGTDAEAKWQRVYAKLLDQGEIDKFRRQLTDISEACGNVANQRADDHVRWLDAARLVDAFDVYDPDDLGSGFCFTQDLTLCTFGMFGVDKNKPKLAEWLKVSKVERKNLYLRASLYNQKDLHDEAGKAFAEAQAQVAAAGGLGQVAGPPFLKAGKGLIDSLKKADSAWDEWLRDKVVKSIHDGKTRRVDGNKIHNLSTFHRSNEGRMYALVSEWAQALSNKAGKMDKAIQGTVGMLLFSRLGDLVEKIGIEELMLKVAPEKLAEGYKKRSAERNRELAERDAAKKANRLPKLIATPDPVDVLVQDEQRKVRDKVQLTLEELDKGKRPETNNFRQARLGVLLMSIEGLALALKLNSGQELSEKGKWEVAASVLSLSSITFDIIYAVAKSTREIAPYKGMVGVDTALDVVRGGLKMTAGTLSAAAGGISMALDGLSFYEETQKDRPNWVLASVYFSRGFAGAFNVGLGLIAAFSYTGPLLLRMSGSGAAVATRLAPFLARAGTFAAEKVMVARTLWLIRVARVNMIGLAITAGEVVYRCWIMDDALEDWCEACTFRKNKSQGWGGGGKPYPNAKRELEELEKAFKAISA
jgi:hypothetical protein